MHISYSSVTFRETENAEIDVDGDWTVSFSVSEDMVLKNYVIYWKFW